MTGEKLDLIWQEWRALLSAEFESRMGAISSKQFGNFGARKKFNAIFLMPEGFPCSSEETLTTVIGYIKGNETDDPGDTGQSDTIAMMGHRFGILENSTGLRQYLQDAQKLLKQHGQIIFTSIEQLESIEKKNPSLSIKQFQQAKLVGPFFNLQSFRPEGLKNQAVAANWNCDFLFRQDDSNYYARLRQPGF